MTSRERKDQITLRQASCILQGARPPGKTRDRRDQCRTIVNGAIESIAEATANHYLATLNPGEWEKLAGLPADYEVFDAPEWLPGFGLEQTLEWIASAPEPHVRLAVEIGVWRTPYRQALLERLLAGQAGPNARAVTPGVYSAPLHLSSALQALPRRELEAVTSSNAGDWPCYADRLLACSEVWRDRDSLELFDALSHIASGDAAEWAAWHRLIVRPHPSLGPSPQMLEIVERFGKPEAVSELYAARVARQLQAALPGRCDDHLLQMEMI